MLLTEIQIATALFAAPFLILSAAWLVGLTLLFRPQRARVVEQKDRSNA